MEAKVIIYGTEECPYVKKAREAYGDKAIFYNVKNDPEKLPKPKVTLWPVTLWSQEMLVYSKGENRVPVIVEKEEVTGQKATVSIGYGGT
jgi:glutaredoxin 3